MRIVLLGPPGAGKGTQAHTISQRLDIPHIASGDLFRDHQRRDTELGRQARSYMDRGLLVPDEVTIRMILERIAQPDCHRGFLLDGFPRTLEQARALDEALSLQGLAIDTAINIKVSPQELLRRLGGRVICRLCQTPYHLVNSPPRREGVCDRCGGELYQRDDDRPEAVEKRIQVYSAQSEPLVDYYTRQDKLREVDGDQSIEEVGEEMVAALSR